jgi:Protein of unknown function (DUF4238)
MAETRRMHFVPRTYLKHFSKEREKEEFFINALSKIDGAKPFETNIKRICVEKDIYTLKGSTEAERQFLENMYNDLYENQYDEIYKILTDDTKHEVTLRERYSIIGFVVSIFFRNNSWGIGYNNLMNETYAKAYYLTKENDQDSFFWGEQEVSIVGKTLEELQKENQKQDKQMIALTSAQNIFRLIRLRVINDVITIVKTSGNYEYITSDNPVTFRADDIKQRPIPLDPANTLSIPIDKYHLLQLRPWGHELDRKMLGRMSENPFISSINVAINNQFQFRQSGMFVLGTENGLRNFRPNLSEDEFKRHLRGI